MVNNCADFFFGSAIVVSGGIQVFCPHSPHPLYDLVRWWYKRERMRERGRGEGGERERERERGREGGRGRKGEF